MDTIFKDFDYLLSERRNPELNKKISLYEQLIEYNNQKNIFIRFYGINKLGLNFKSQWSLISPIGIYSYPINYVLDVLKNIGGEKLPFAFDKRYVFVLEKNDDPNYIFIEDTKEYNNLKADCNILKKHVDEDFEWDNSNNNYRSILLETINNYEGFNVDQFKWFYDLTRSLSKLIAKLSGYKVNRGSVDHIGSVWNYLMREICGYSGYGDKNNSHIIHSDINYEYVFLSTKFVRTKEVLMNQFYNKRD